MTCSHKVFCCERQDGCSLPFGLEGGMVDGLLGHLWVLGVDREVVGVRDLVLYSSLRRVAASCGI